MGERSVVRGGEGGVEAGATGVPVASINGSPVGVVHRWSTTTLTIDT